MIINIANNHLFIYLFMKKKSRFPLHYTTFSVKWEDRKMMHILHKKVEEMSYSLGDNDHYIDESKDILKSTLNDDVLTDSDGGVDDM